MRLDAERMRFAATTRSRRCGRAALALSAALLLGLLAVAITAPAESVSQLPKPSGYVNDFAHMLEPETAANMDSLCQQVEQKAQAQIAVVTINSLDGADILDYAVQLYQRWGIGQKGKDRGVLILLSKEDRKYYISVGYGLEGILPDGKVGGFGREAVPYLKQGDYNNALWLLTGRVAATIAEDAGVELTGPQPRAPAYRRERSQGPSGIKIVFIVIIILLAIFVPPFRRLLFWMFIFGNMGGGRRGGGDFGGGGFGGGGGGFGGFGGGSTGGGGAGGSW